MGTFTTQWDFRGVSILPLTKISTWEYVPGKHCGNIRRHWRGHNIENQQGPSCIRHLKTSVDLTRKLRVFVNRCLRTIFKIRWPRIVSNNELREMSGQEDITVEIARRKWRWVGHVLRKDQHDITREAIFWTADGKRKRGRPKTTWRRTAESELKQIGLSWRTVETRAKDRTGWRDCVAALCATWHEED